MEKEAGSGSQITSQEIVPEIPVETPSVVEKKKSRKWLIIGLVVFLLTVLVIVGYLAYRNSQIKKQTVYETQPTLVVETPGLSSINDWKTLFFNRLGISFKHPPGWFKLVNQADEVALVTTDPGLGGNLSGVWTIKHQNPAKLTLKDFWKKQHEETSESYVNNLEPNYLEEITIDSYQALRENPDSAPERLERTRIFIEKPPFVYEIQGITPEGNEQEKTIFNQILSTFEFIDQADLTVGWKTYSNGNYSYSLKYPDSWETIPSTVKGSKTEAIGLHGAELQGKIMYLHSGYPQNIRIPFLQIETISNETQESYETEKQSRLNGQGTLVGGYPAITSKQESLLEPGTNITKEGYRYSWFIFNTKLNTIYDVICYEDLFNENLCNQILSTFEFIE